MTELPSLERQLGYLRRVIGRRGPEVLRNIQEIRGMGTEDALEFLLLEMYSLNLVLTKVLPRLDPGIDVDKIMEEILEELKGSVN